MGQRHSTEQSTFIKAFAAMGVVFGDIGTSPLYAMKEVFGGAHGIPLSEANIYGIVSLVLWALIVVISIKYMLFILNADNRGEGGILSLMALTLLKAKKSKFKWFFIVIGLFGGALLFGDGMITPAISVLSAVEGLELAVPTLKPFIIPITIAILVLFFVFQHKGTTKIGYVFGPIISVYFLMIGTLGFSHIIQTPEILTAINPVHGLQFLLAHKAQSFVALGAVFLVVTGGESLYADMGHFGKRPIKLAWFSLVLPALALNYCGQGANLLKNPSAVENPFYRLAPEWALLPIIGICTLATIIASQAVVSGVFSLARQAVQLGYAPRLKIVHTSKDEIGQIYVPQANWALMVATIWLVIEFKSSSNLAAAYGIAVSTTMVITTILACVVARKLWGWKLWAVMTVLALFLTVDLAFFFGNFLKIAQGGWFPLAVAALLYCLMATWRKGRQILMERVKAQSLPLADFIEGLKINPPVRIPGAAVFMTGDADGTPAALLHNMRHNKILHEKVIFVTIISEKIPFTEKKNRIRMDSHAFNIHRAIVKYGFMETPNIIEIINYLNERGVALTLPEITFFLGRETLLASKHPGMALWREHLFVLMSRNAQRATAFFQIPPDQVVEIGIQVEI